MNGSIQADLKLKSQNEPNKFDIKYILSLYEIANVKTEGVYEIWDTVCIFYLNNY
jgi:hypothetical protein